MKLNKEKFDQKSLKQQESQEEHCALQCQEKM